MSIFRLIAQPAIAIMVLSLSSPAASEVQEPLPVVASFSILGDMVERIGGNQVTVTTLVGPDSDAHVYQPTPAAARALSSAELFVVNGLQFEGWLERLIDASNFNGERVVAAQGIDAIPLGGSHADGHHHAAYDPHAWQSLDNAVVYVDNITAALIRARPEHATTFQANRADYVAEIEALDTRIRQMVSELPEDRRTVVTSHDAFQYFGREYGLTFLSPQGISTESEASAQDVARLIRRIRDEDIASVFIENTADSRLLERIADETDATISKHPLYPEALSGTKGPAPTYLKMMRHNAVTLTQALQQSQ